MKKELYEKPKLEIIVLLDVDIITESEIESGDEDLTEKFGFTEELIQTLKELLSPWCETDGNGNIIFDESGKPQWKNLNEDATEEDITGWIKAQDDYEKIMNDFKNSNDEEDPEGDTDIDLTTVSPPSSDIIEGDNTGSSQEQTDNNQDIDLESSNEVTNPESIEPSEEVSSLAEALYQALSETEGENTSEGINGFTEEDIINSESQDE